MVHRIWFPFILFLLCVQQRLCDDTEYSVQFASAIGLCDGFNDSWIDPSNMILNKIVSDDEDEPDIMCMDGSLKVLKQIGSGVMINLRVYKETGSSRELMMTSAAEFCGALKDDKAPYKAMFEAMGINGCPVEEKTYEVNKLTMELGFLKQFLCHEYCLEYYVELEFTDMENEVICCCDLGASISEV